MMSWRPFAGPRQLDQRETRWTSEEQLSAWLAKELSPCFDILIEVPGVGYIKREKRNVRLDFVIRAKKHLIDAGFTDQYLGIEVKYLNYVSGHGFIGKASKGVFQALSYWYSGATWDVGEEQPVTLAAVLMFSNLSFPEEREHLFQTYDQFYKTLWWAYNRIATQANVGELVMLDYGRQGTGWAIEFNRAKYFTKFPGNRLVLGNAHLINKTRIGNSR